MAQETWQPGTLRIGTRTSQLALWQTAHVAARLQAAWPGLRCEQVSIITQGDRRLDRPLPEIGGKGLFTAELEQALLTEEIDLAVHSLKDLPVENTPGLTVGAVLSREDVRDVLVAPAGVTLATLPPGAVVGTSSLRRQAQLLALRPDLRVRPIRGNVDTRIRKVLAGEYDAAVLAGAGLERLGLAHHVAERLSLDVMLPAPGQGALAVQCRAGDVRVRELLAPLEETPVRIATYAERRLLWLLGGGCSAPIAAYAVPDPDGSVMLKARVGAPDGRRLLEATATRPSADSAAVDAATALFRQGATALLSGPDQPPTSPLAGKRVVITRSREQADEIAVRLAAAGATPLLAPAIEIVPNPDRAALDAALEPSSGLAWIVFTSTNAVECFWRYYQERADAGSAWRGPRLAAIGPATELALLLRGLPVSYVPAAHTGEALAAGLPFNPGDRILLPRAAIARESLPRQLAARGAQVEDIPLYDTQPAPFSSETLAMLKGGFDVVTFTSGSTARSFVAAARADEEVAQLLAAALIACIGPATAAVVEELGLHPAIIAQEQSAPGLLAALHRHFALA
ncbi:MAG TPA: hydroxymethylbilane synthase [Caldilineaceae bacterium]|nr:hydroxymethylbilane synthase [Caldilineaceae bacterium]